jgi:MFS family permease
MSRDLRLLGFSLLCWGIGEGMFVYLLPLYLEELGANPVQIGAVLGVAAMVMMVTHIPAGTLSDIFGRKRLMTTGWITGLVAGGLMYLAHSLPLFILGLVSYHFTAFVVAPLNAYTTEARGEWSVARALTTISASYSAGTIMGSLSGGLIGESIGIRNVFGISALLFSLSTIFMVTLRKQPIVPSSGGGRFRPLITNAPLGLLLFLISISIFAMYLGWPLTPNYLQNVRSVTLQQIGLLGSFNALGMLVLNLTLGRLNPRLGFAITHVVVGISIILLWQGQAMPWFVVGYFLAAGYRTAITLANAQTQELVTSAEIGLVYGITATLSNSALVIAPPIAGLLYRSSPALPYPIGLGVLVIAMLLYLILAPRIKHVDVHPIVHTGVPK